MDPDVLRYGRIGPRQLLPENPWFIEHNVNAEKVVRSNVLRKRTGTSSQNSELKVAKWGKKLPTRSCCKQRKLPQSKAKCTEKCEVVKWGNWPSKGNITKEEKQCSMACGICHWVNPLSLYMIWIENLTLEGKLNYRSPLKERKRSQTSTPNLR